MFAARLAALLTLVALTALASVSSDYIPFVRPTGDAPSILFGRAVAGVPDTDGDGLDDILVGAPLASASVNQSGSAFLFSGATGALIRRHDGNYPGEQLGVAVAGIPDLDGDGRGDYLIGAPYDNEGVAADSGTVFVISGATGAVVRTHDGMLIGDDLGLAVAGTPDLDGDGRGDYLIGAPFGTFGTFPDAGIVLLVSGRTGVTIRAHGGPTAFERLGHSLAAVPDTDGDGVPDYLLGTPIAAPDGLDGAGAAYLFSGANGALIRSHLGDAPAMQLALSLCGAGDVDGDGSGDYLISAPGAADDAGAALLFSGATGVLIRRHDGAVAGDRLGLSVAAVPDRDGDGADDYLLGAPGGVPGSANAAGSALLFSGASGALLQRFEGSNPRDQFGFAVAGVRDLNGDDRGDLLIGAPAADPGGVLNAGAATLFATPSIFGIVRDPSGAPVPGAMVTATAYYFAPSATADAEGRYALGALDTGVAYAVRASALGFIAKPLAPTVIAAQSLRRDFTLGTIALTSPGNTQTVSGFVPVSAAAADPTGIQLVDFFDGDTFIGHAAAAPYGVLWPSLQDCAHEGPRTLTAVATAGDSETGVSLPVTVTVDNTTFSDVPCSHFAWRFIEAVNRDALLRGFGDGSFRPDQTVTRAALAVAAAQVADRTRHDLAAFTPPPCRQETFSDVLCTHPVYRFIEYAAARGLMSGAGRGRFLPGSSVTRGALAVVLTRLRLLGAGIGFAPPPCGHETFADVPCTHPLYAFIEFAALEGLVRGFPDGTYRPAAPVTHAQLAVVVTRVAGLSF